MLEQRGSILVQFFQHAHHRAEGWLIDFQESLDQGRLDPELFDRAVKALCQHMYVEEEMVFPLVEEPLAGPIAGLREEHGHIEDLVDQVKALLYQGAEMSRLQTLTLRLMSLLAAHCAEEDLGIYPDLVSLLGSERALALLEEAERAEAPAGWVCASRG